MARNFSSVGSIGGSVYNCSESFLAKNGNTNVTLTCADLLDYAKVTAILKYTGFNNLDATLTTQYSIDGTNWTDNGLPLTLDNVAGADTVIVITGTGVFPYRYYRFVYNKGTVTAGTYQIVLLGKN